MRILGQCLMGPVEAAVAPAPPGVTQCVTHTLIPRQVLTAQVNNHGFRELSAGDKSVWKGMKDSLPWCLKQGTAKKSSFDRDLIIPAFPVGKANRRTAEKQKEMKDGREKEKKAGRN
ncbi:hypothetical protein H920_20070 [Fukomys damarensis]|uniref:Uncharacterized protein n=1 Tax=Fukomys damarensis TaxID=885580 RepID=A0A091CL87_FUKDA|nr:hypothetical protein H920_20070 [Fukomys damarensis]